MQDMEPPCDGRTDSVYLAGIGNDVASLIESTNRM